MDVASQPSLHVTVYIQRVVKRRQPTDDDQEISFSNNVIVAHSVRTLLTHSDLSLHCQSHATVRPVQFSSAALYTPQRQRN